MLFRKRIRSKLEDVHRDTASEITLGLNHPEVISRVPLVDVPGGGDEGDDDRFIGSNGGGDCRLGNGIDVGGDGGGGRGGCLEDMVDMMAVQDMMLFPFNLCSAPSAQSRGQRSIQTMVSGPMKPGKVASKAIPGPGSIQPNRDGDSGDPRRRAGTSRGSQADCVSKVSAWQHGSYNGGVGVGPGKASELDSQKPADSFTYTAGPSVEPPPPPSHPPTQQLESVSATLGYSMTTPSASSCPGPGPGSTIGRRQDRDDIPGRLPAWPGPYRNWLESRDRDSEEQLPQTWEDSEATGTDAAAADGSGGRHMC